jgi:hypothetical protein
MLIREGRPGLILGGEFRGSWVGCRVTRAGEHIRFGYGFMRPLSLDLLGIPRNLRSVH